MYTVYILKSLGRKRFYVGQTGNIKSRLTQHNKRKIRSTKGYAPWKIIHTESFASRSDACKREQEIKKYKSGILFKKLISRGTQVDNEDRL